MNYLRRGMSLIELTIVLVLIATVAAIAGPRLLGVSDAAEENNAKASLSSVLDIEMEEYARTGSFTTNLETLKSRAGITAVTTGVNPTDFTDPAGSSDVAASTSPQTVSVGVTGSVLSAAASAGDGKTCWLVRRDFNSTGSGIMRYGFVEAGSATTCTASTAYTALNPMLPGAVPGVGESWSSPVVVI